MTRPWIIILIILTFISSCSDNETNKDQSEKTSVVYSEKYSGISIENDQRQGSPYFDSSGIECFYLCKKTTITNDTTVPIKLTISFTKEYNYLLTNNGLNSKVFLLPEELTMDEQQFNVTLSKELKFELGMTKELKKFLDKSAETISLNKILNPKESCIMRFGILTDLNYQMPNYFGLKLKTNEFQFNKQDNNTQRLTPNGKPLILPIVLYLDNPYVIPCGEVSFPTK